MKRHLCAVAAGKFLVVSMARGIASVLPLYEAHCREPIPAFTLGGHSNPAPDQEKTLCACIWDGLDPANRVTAKAIHDGRQQEISPPSMQALIAHFGDAVEKCGGMKM